MKRLFPFFCSLLLLLALGLPVAWAAQPDTVSVQFHDETAGRYESAVVEKSEKEGIEMKKLACLGLSLTMTLGLLSACGGGAETTPTRAAV